MAEVTDLINSVVDKNAIEFGKSFDSIMRSRIQTAIENKRIELAQSIYGDSEDDIDVDYESDDDLDFDIDLEDLEDFDYEGNTDDDES